MPKKHVLCFLIVLLVLLSSCENFMKGSGVKDELNRLVEEANAPEVELYIACDPKYGVVAPSGYVSYKKGQSFNLVFLENPGYQFTGWQVQDKTSLQQVQGALAFENPTAKETKAKLLTSTKNLYISPVCLELPQVESFYPSEIDNGVFANTPIRIKFNIAVQFPDQQMTGRQLVKVMQIYPLVQGEPVDISDYYNLPILSEDEKTITLTPKAQELSAYIQNQNMEKLIRVKVSLNADINTMVNGKALYRYVPDNTDDAFYYRVNPHVEDTPPEKINFFATRDELLYDELSASDVPSLSGFTPLESGVLEGTALSEVQAESVYSRMAGQYIYFYGEYKDTDSGFDSILVEEKFVNTKEGIPSPDKDWVRGDASGLVKWDTATGSTRFILKYKIKSNDGAINLKITPYDFCGNKSPSQQYTIFKSTRIGLENVEPFNWLGGKSINEEYWYDVQLLDDEDGESVIKTVRIAYECSSTSENCGYADYIKGHELKELLYKNIYLNPDKYLVFYKIPGKDYIPFEFYGKYEELDYDIQIKSWIKTFDVDSVEGLEFSILVKDVLGNSEERKYQFPGSPEVVNTAFMDDDIVYMYSNYPFTGIISLKKDESIHSQTRGNAVSLDLYDTFACKNNNLIGPLKTINLYDYIEEWLPNSIEIDEVSSTGSELYFDKQNVFVKLNPASWYYDEELFDEIYIRYELNNDKNVDEFGKKICGIQKFSKATNECIISVDKEELYQYGLNLYVWGKKGYETSAEIKYAEPDLFVHDSEIIQDTQPPRLMETETGISDLIDAVDLYFDSTEFDYETFLLHPEIQEFMSGLDYIEWWTDEFPDIKYTAGWEYEWKDLIIPNWDMDSSVVHLHLAATDKAGNKAEYILPYIFYNDVFTLDYDIERSSSTCYVPNEMQFWNNQKLIITRKDIIIDSNSQEYEPLIIDYSDKDLWLLGMDISRTEFEIHFNELTIPDADYTKLQGKLVKITMAGDRVIDNIKRNAVSVPIYSYIGDFPADHTGKGKLVCMENGAQVSSDLPVYIHTLVTKQPYTECSKWDIQKWQMHRKSVCEEYFDFTEYSFDLYEIDMSEISPGECYIIVAHFSDGSIKYSSVRQR